LQLAAVVLLRVNEKTKLTTGTLSKPADCGVQCRIVG